MIIIIITLFDIQHAFITIVNAERYKCNCDICNEAWKLSTMQTKSNNQSIAIESQEKQLQQKTRVNVN